MYYRKHPLPPWPGAEPCRWQPRTNTNTNTIINTNTNANINTDTNTNTYKKGRTRVEGGF